MRTRLKLLYLKLVWPKLRKTIQTHPLNQLELIVNECEHTPQKI